MAEAKAAQPATMFEKIWRRHVVVDRPDGYTLLVAGGTFTIGPLLEKTPYDPIRDFEPITLFVPGAPALSPKGAVQINDVYVDDRGIVYAGDRFTGGLYVLEMNI